MTCWIIPTFELAPQQFEDYRPDLAERIRICSNSPRTALNEARRLQEFVRPDWFQVHITKVSDQPNLVSLSTDLTSSQMYETLRLKFSQHLDLRAELLNTGDATLIEVSLLRFSDSPLRLKLLISTSRLLIRTTFGVGVQIIKAATSSGRR